MEPGQEMGFGVAVWHDGEWLGRLEEVDFWCLLPGPPESGADDRVPGAFREVVFASGETGG